jgi:hypothetical protein
VADFCERAARVQGLDPVWTPQDMRLLALAFIDDADRFRELGQRPTARRIRSYAFFLRNRAKAPDTIPARAIDPRLLTMCVSGAEPGG